MSAEVRVSLASLDVIARQLVNAARSLGDSGGGAPSTVDGGIGSDLMVSIAKQLSTNAAHVCSALEASSDGVRASSESYDATDADAARRLAKLESR